MHSTTKPCIMCKNELDPSVMTMVKVETIIAGTVRSNKIPVFSGSHGVEGLFYVIDQFMKATGRLQFTPTDLWDQFEEVLDSVAEQKWANLIQPIANAARNWNRFNRAVSDFVALHAEDEIHVTC